MKRIFILAVLLLSFAYGNAQSPQKMSFQAVIRNSTNSLVSNLPIGLRVSILQGTPSGAIVYSETQTANTNVNGLVTIQIGGGNVIQGDFSTIEWANGPYFIQTETDVNGGTNYTITSTTQLLSVPYALYAQTSGSSIPGPQGPVGAAGPQGIAGTNGANGLSAYEIAVQNGYTGTESQWLSTAIVGAQGPAGQNGLSAYEIAVQNGYTGTEQEWLTTAIVGPQGIQGPAGANGLSAYEVAVQNGYIGTESQWLSTAVVGPQGPAGQNGNNGQDGLSAYQIWLNHGNTGTEAQFLASLQGATGAQGEQGPIGLTGTQGVAGATGAQGPAGANGINGTNGTNGTNGLSAYQVWLNLGNVGTEADFIASLKGPQGAQGPAGQNGNDGLSAYQIWLNSGNTGTEAQFFASLQGAQGPQGIQGEQGTAGANGQNGLNTLVNTSTEPAGTNCASGGTKIEVGLDIDGNGVLNVSEVNNALTKYICNGISNSNSSNSTLIGAKIGIFSSTSWTCPSNVTKIKVELWGAGGGYVITAMYSCASNGGNGGYNSGILNVIPNQIYNITIGNAGGNANANAPAYAGAGGSTIFDTLIAEGGGGAYAPSSNYSCVAGSNGNINNWPYNFVQFPNYIPSSYLAVPSTAPGGCWCSGLVSGNDPVRNAQNGYCIITILETN